MERKIIEYSKVSLCWICQQTRKEQIKSKQKTKQNKKTFKFKFPHRRKLDKKQINWAQICGNKQ